MFQNKYNQQTTKQAGYQQYTHAHIDDKGLSFSKQDYIMFEKYLLELLDWNVMQTTPYHFFQALLAQGIVLSHEKQKQKMQTHKEQEVSEYSGESEIEECSDDNQNTSGIRRPYGIRSKSSKRTQRNNKELSQLNTKSYSNKKLIASKTNEIEHIFELKDINSQIIESVRE